MNSRKNISLSAVDAFNNVVGQITLDSDHVILKNKKLYIQDGAGRTLLFADDKKIKMNIEHMDISGIPICVNLITRLNNIYVRLAQTVQRQPKHIHKVKPNIAK